MKKDILGKNNPNYKDGRTLKKTYCIDCNKQLYDFRNKRCLSCKIKNQFKTGNIRNKGKNHYRWKGGKPKCIDCGIKLRDYLSKRCKSCAMKKRFKNGLPQKTKEKLSVISKKRLKNPENHPNWKGGISKIPYSFNFNNILKEEIRKRDNYTCQICNMTEEEHLIVYARILTVHHIDYDKKNSEKYNLVSLCIPCNFRVNYNRSYWIDYFKAKTVEYICGEEKL